MGSYRSCGGRLHYISCYGNKHSNIVVFIEDHLTERLSNERLVFNRIALPSTPSPLTSTTLIVDEISLMVLMRRPGKPFDNPRLAAVPFPSNSTRRRLLRAHMEELVQTVLRVDMLLWVAIALDTHTDVAVFRPVGGPGSWNLETGVVAELMDGVRDLAVVLVAFLVVAGVDDGNDCHGHGCQKAENGKKLHVGRLLFRSRAEREQVMSCCGCIV